LKYQIPDKRSISFDVRNTLPDFLEGGQIWTRIRLAQKDIMNMGFNYSKIEDTSL